VVTAVALNSPAAIEAEIQRLYRHLRGELRQEEFTEGGSRRRPSARYAALETEIRTLADRYAALLETRS
jgi:hypothetical protein